MPPGARRDVFQAIADPTRRQIIALLANRPMNLNSLAENFAISRPAVSQQIKILTECGLVTIKQQGRERYCEAKLAALQDISDWIAPYQAFWEARMDKLGDLLEDIQSDKKAKRKKPGKWKRK